MRPTRRTTLSALVAAGALAAASLLVATPAAAQDAAAYPSRPIRVIVPFAAGGGTDVITRQLATQMAPLLKGQIVVENRPGANGIVAAQAAARSAPDGHVLLMTSLTTHSVNPHLHRSLPYDPVADFAPIGLVGFTAPVLMHGADVPAKSVQDVVAMARRAPGAVAFATPNTSSLFATEMFEHQAGVSVNKVRYNNTPQAHADVSAGRVQFVFGDFTAGGPLLQSGRLRALAVASPARLATHPDVPTLAEAGLPGIEVQIWVGLFAPRGTPAEIVERLNQALGAALATDEVKAGLAKQATVARPMRPDEFQRYLAGQHEHWGRMARLLNVQPE